MYRNATAFHINETTLPIIDFSRRSERKIGALESKVVMWCPIIGEDLVANAGDGLFFCMLTKEKILPESVVADQVGEIVKDIEKRDGITLSKKQISSYKSQIREKLLATAFVKKSYTVCFLNKDYFIVDTPSVGRAEDALTLLRETMGGLNAKPVTGTDIPTTLTHWGMDSKNVPESFVRTGNYAIKSPMGDKKVKLHNFFDGEALGAEDYTISGGIVTEMSLNYGGKISFTLTDSFILKGVHYDLSSCDKDPTNQYEIMMAEFEITARELVNLFNVLVGVLCYERED